MVRVVVVAWMAGLISHSLVLWIIWRQTIGQELIPLAVILAVSLCITVPALYLPGMYLLKRWQKGTRPAWPFAALGCLLGAGPFTLAFAIPYQLSMRQLFSPESQLLYVMFATVGVTIGYGFALTERAGP
jgi:hypothetical protein